MSKTIKAGDAEDLAHRDDGSEVNGWSKVADQEIRESRWGTYNWLVLMDASGALWGLRYFRGATEIQEHEYPWHGRAEDAELELTRLYSFTREIVEYSDQP